MSKYILPTYTGIHFDLVEATEEMICIEDIAHHLAAENRYNGATKFPYSVAQHSILVSEECPEDLMLEGLLHDAEEAYFKDLTYWWKILLKEELGTNLWDRSVEWVKALIATKFQLRTDEEAHKIIKNIDLRAAKTEKLQLVKNPLRINQEIKPFNRNILMANPFLIEKAFLDAFYRLKRN